MESILDTVKTAIGINVDDTSFDNSLIISINTSLSILSQLGIGPDGGVIVRNKDDTWDKVTMDKTNIEHIKSYVCLKTRLLFDPPSNASALAANERLIQELEWRIVYH